MVKCDNTHGMTKYNTLKVTCGKLIHKHMNMKINIFVAILKI